MTGPSSSQSPHDLGVIDLLKETLATTGQLAEKQIQLLRAELTSTLVEERRRLIAASTAGGLVMCGAAMLLTAGGLAIGFAVGHPVLLLAAVGVLVTGGAMAVMLGAIKRLEHPPSLASSIHIVEQEIEWAKGKLAETKSSSSPET